MRQQSPTTNMNMTRMKTPLNSKRMSKGYRYRCRLIAYANNIPVIISAYTGECEWDSLKPPCLFGME